MTAKQLYFRLARIKDCAAIRGPPPQPDILDDVLGLRRASENAVLESAAAFGYYLRGMGVNPVRRIPKILDLVMEPVAISHMSNFGRLHGTHSRLVSEVHPKIGLRPERSHAG